MSIIIDGHNLIPKIEGLSLRDPEDERKLIEMLQEYCRLQRKKAEVFFDNAPPAQARSQRFGQVMARFVRSGRTADDAIRDRLGQLKHSAQNYTVVSSDFQVQVAAREAHAQVVSSDQFAQQLRKTLMNAEGTTAEPREPRLDDEEIEDWLRLFGGSNETRPK
jgi:predicted RNA-binding protein with PIN domain